MIWEETNEEERRKERKVKMKNNHHPAESSDWSVDFQTGETKWASRPSANHVSASV